MRVAFAKVVLASCAFVGLAVAAGAGAGAGGCSEPTGPRTVASEELTVKIPAIKEAARAQDLLAAPQLVQDLESDDPAVRLFAIKGLRKIAGQEFGYVYFADAEHRRPAVIKWREWLRQQGAATRPSDNQ